MIHLGDITKIRGCTAPIVDCMIGGSPCQDLSIAGARAGFNGERSVLFLDQIRVTKEMRHRDRASGRTGEFVRPRYMVWENVPGAFSSNGGRDFQSVLTETVRVVEPEAPVVPMPEKGWPTSGCLMGDGWSIAWRVLDAQFWGVPQRRRRIALVADFGGQSAPEILFVRKSLSGNPEPGRTAGEGTASGAEKSAGNPVYCLQGNGIDRADTAGCNGKGWKEDVCYTLNTIDRPAVFAGTLRAQEHGHQPLVTVFDPAQITSPVNRSRPEPGKPCHTLTSRMGTGGGNVTLVAFGIGNGQANEAAAPAFEKARTLNTMHDVQAVFCAAVDCRNGTENPEINGTLQAKSTGGSSVNLQNVCRVNKTVRRLTPLECERLQGFPDGWTDIGPWTDSKGKLHKESYDSCRYKALGNSIALPPWKWVLKRLCAQYERDATMASLFDGISGFCVIWAQLNGIDSIKFTSEIEEFPMAVCKKHFGNEETGQKGDFHEAILGRNKG